MIMHNDDMINFLITFLTSGMLQAAGEHIRPYLSYLPGLTDLIGRTGVYVPSWVR